MLWVRVHGCCRMFGMVAAGCSAPCLCIVPIGQALHCNLYCCLHHHPRPCYSPIQHPHPQVRPMGQELLGLSEQQLALVQALALLATAAVMAANVRTLLQRYLDRGLTGGWTTAGCGVVGKRGHMCSRAVALLPAGCHYCIRSSPRLAAIGWHQLKHGSKAARGNREQKQSLGELIRLHCQVGGCTSGGTLTCTIAMHSPGTTRHFIVLLPTCSCPPRPLRPLPPGHQLPAGQGGGAVPGPRHAVPGHGPPAAQCG